MEEVLVMVVLLRMVLIFVTRVLVDEDEVDIEDEVVREMLTFTIDEVVQEVHRSSQDIRERWQSWMLLLLHRVLLLMVRRVMQVVLRRM
jgi:hypothetical protein